MTSFPTLASISRSWGIRNKVVEGSEFARNDRISEKRAGKEHRMMPSCVGRGWWLRKVVVSAEEVKLPDLITDLSPKPYSGRHTL